MLGCNVTVKNLVPQIQYDYMLIRPFDLLLYEPTYYRTLCTDEMHSHTCQLRMVSITGYLTGNKINTLPSSSIFYRGKSPIIKSYMMVLSTIKVYMYKDGVTGCPKLNNMFRKCS